MILTARAKPMARERIPAVIHHDGTGRLQIVRRRGRSLLPRVPTRHGAQGWRRGLSQHLAQRRGPDRPYPEQAIQTLKRAKGIDGLLMIGKERNATLVWLENRPEARRRLIDSVGRWATETGFELPEGAPVTANA